MRPILLALLLTLTACTGEDYTEDTGRTDCEDACYQQEFLTCSAGCAPACEGTTGDERDRCIDGCQGDCLTDYNACVDANCTE